MAKKQTYENYFKEYFKKNSERMKEIRARYRANNYDKSKVTVKAYAERQKLEQKRAT